MRISGVDRRVDVITNYVEKKFMVSQCLCSCASSRETHCDD